MRPRIRSEVICYVLAGVSQEASDFLRFKYAGDRSKIKNIACRLATKVLRREAKSRRKKSMLLAYPNFLLDLAYVAIEEANGDGLCGTCNGKGWIDTGVKRIDCFKCESSGRRRLGDIAIANKLDVDVWFYRQYGKSVLEKQMLGTLASYEGDLYNAFRERL